MPQKTKITAGMMIGDTYRLNAQIGAGGMGEVWLAEHTRLPGLQVAVKFLFGGKVKGDDFSRFQREAYIMASLHHPHITKVIDLNVLPDETPYIVLEYLKGEPLSDRLERGGLDAQEVCHIIAQVGSALQATHSKEIIHRDLKPDNIFLCETPDGDLPHVKVLDFGVSKVRSLEKKITVQEQGFLGTPQYMSPEQAMGNADVDQAADQFSLGIITYEMLSGYLPFGGEQLIQIVTSIIQSEPIPLRELVPLISADVEHVVHRALSKQKEHRFPSCNAYVSAFVQAMMDSTEERDDWDIESLTEIISGEDSSEPVVGDTLTMKNIGALLKDTSQDLPKLGGLGIEGDDQTRVDGDQSLSVPPRQRAMSREDELVNQAFSFSSLWKTPLDAQQGEAPQLKEWGASSGASVNHKDPLVSAQVASGAELVSSISSFKPSGVRSQDKLPLIALGLLVFVGLITLLSVGQGRASLDELTQRATQAPEITEPDTFEPYQALIQSVKLNLKPASALTEPMLYERLTAERYLELETGREGTVTAYVSLSKSALKQLNMSHGELRASWGAEGVKRINSDLNILLDVTDSERMVLYTSHTYTRASPKRWVFALMSTSSEQGEGPVLIAPFELKEVPVKQPPPKKRRSKPRRRGQKKKIRKN